MHQKPRLLLNLIICYDPRKGREMHLVCQRLPDVSHGVTIPVKGARCIAWHKRRQWEAIRLRSP